MSGCIWRGSLEPRAIRNRHDEDGCVDIYDEPDPSCRGCLPCPHAHCVVCGIEHVGEQTCPACIGAARDGLLQIRNMFAQLPTQAVDGGGGGKLEAARPIPGGEAMVLMSPGSDGRARGWARERGDDVSHRGDELPSDPYPPTVMMTTWEDDWRKIKSQPAEDLATVFGAWDYLDGNLAWAAQNHDAFDSFAEEIRQQVARLEDVLQAGDRPEATVGCLHCRGKLVRGFSKRTGFSDTYKCESCFKTYNRDQYLGAVKAAWIAMAPSLPAEYAAIRLGIPATRIRVWGSRYPELKDGHNENGLWLYKVSDLAAKLEESREDDDDSAA